MLTQEQANKLVDEMYNILPRWVWKDTIQKIVAPYCCASAPSQADVNWVINSMQRHPEGIQAWWKENALTVGPDQMIRLILTVWEAGRGRSIQEHNPNAIQFDVFMKALNSKIKYWDSREGNSTVRNALQAIKDCIVAIQKDAIESTDKFAYGCASMARNIQSGIKAKLESESE